MGALSPSRYYYRMRGKNIKQIMSHHPGGLQGAKRTAGQGVMSCLARGYGRDLGPENWSKVQSLGENLDQKWPVRPVGPWPRGSPIISAQVGVESESRHGKSLRV